MAPRAGRRHAGRRSHRRRACRNRLKQVRRLQARRGAAWPGLRQGPGRGRCRATYRPGRPKRPPTARDCRPCRPCASRGVPPGQESKRSEIRIYDELCQTGRSLICNAKDGKPTRRRYCRLWRGHGPWKRCTQNSNAALAATQVSSELHRAAAHIWGKVEVAHRPQRVV